MNLLKIETPVHSTTRDIEQYGYPEVRHFSQIEEAHDTRRNHIEIYLQKNQPESARDDLVDWADKLIEAKKAGLERPDRFDFQASMAEFLANSDLYPVLASKTIGVAELLEDTEVRGNFLNRQLEPSRSYIDPNSMVGHWQPFASETKWLIMQRIDLEGHPATEAIDLAICISLIKRRHHRDIEAEKLPMTEADYIPLNPVSPPKLVSAEL